MRRKSSRGSMLRHLTHRACRQGLKLISKNAKKNDLTKLKFIIQFMKYIKAEDHDTIANENCLSKTQRPPSGGHLLMWHHNEKNLIMRMSFGSVFILIPAAITSGSKSSQLE